MPTLTADHYFTLGTFHARAGEPCQDYALSGTLKDARVYGLVTDGCSGANARTDLGARVLALAMEAELQHTTSLEDCFTPESIQRIRTRLQAMPLGGTPQDYLASIVAFCATTTTAKVFMAGDGAYATRHTNGTVQITEASWPDNAPYYLGYCLQPAVAAQFNASATKGALSVQLSTHTTGENSSTTQDIPAQDFLQGWTTEIALSDISALTICSDGISQISKLESLDAATACLAFKNFEGSFVKRRAMKALAQWERSGHIPQDDFSIAALARVQQEGAP
ncbi:MAG: protein phosphatase 2C domain-containing protein [Rhodoferax sp.]|nr:protein phosphatase 2C domain-containing protein [Rhodoferax sp.]MDP3653134.1 protein phosphatase 2C domain-containing protein [Rhodoferax sp.]